MNDFTIDLVFIVGCKLQV